MTGIKVIISVYGYTCYNLDKISMSHTAEYRVAGWGSSTFGYTVCNLDIIIGITSPWQTG